MEMFATVLSVICIVTLVWQIFGSIWNIIAIFFDLFKKQQ